MQGKEDESVGAEGSVARRMGFDRLKGADLKAPIEITFIDQEECVVSFLCLFFKKHCSRSRHSPGLCGNWAGIDGRGVFKEFFTSLCKEIFDTDGGLWLANKKNELYPNPHASFLLLCSPGANYALFG